MNQISASYQTAQNLVNLWLGLGEAVTSFSRTWMESALSYYLPSETSGLVSSMIFGGSENLHSKLRHSFSVIGMQHVTAASGFNVGLMSNLANLLISRFCHRRIGAFFSLGVIWFYVALAQGSASVVRAGCMLSFSLIANRIFYRRANLFWSLLLAVAVMLIINHKYLSDIGFQLSVTSTLGLLTITPLLEKQSWWNSIELQQEDQESSLKNAASMSLFQQGIDMAKDTAATTIAAQSWSLPLLLFHFQEFSALSILANIMLLWLTPLITISGVVLIFLALISNICNVFVFPTHLWAMGVDFLTQGFITGVQFLGQWERTLITTPEVHLSFIGVWWLGLAVIILFFKHKHS